MDFFRTIGIIQRYISFGFLIDSLSNYRNPMEISQSCRGAIILVSAVIHTEDSCNFVVANGRTHTYHLRAVNEVERQKWVTSLELAKVRAIRQMDAEDDDYYDLAHDKNELQTILKALQVKLETLSTCNDVVMKHANALQRSLIELEQIENTSDAISKTKAINERATHYRITSSAMLNASVEYMNCAQSYSKKLQKLLHHEHESRLKLEDLVEQLAQQHSHLEQRAIKQQQATEQSAFQQNENTEEDEFYDAEENNPAEFVVTFPGKAHRIHSTPTLSVMASTNANSSSESTNTFDDPNGKQRQNERQKRRLRRRKRKESNLIHDSGNSNEEEDDVDEEEDVYTSEEDIEVDVVTRKLDVSSPTTALTNDQIDCKNLTNNSPNLDDISSTSDTFKSVSNGSAKVGARERRKAIPVRPNHSLNLWSIMKNCIGKELTKIPMPVNFNEPLSMLQRMTEEFEYAHILHKAATIEDSLEQLVYVAAFSVTCYATTSNRTNKPFNPLLGETYECDRKSDLGWRAISEQVCLLIQFFYRLLIDYLLLL